jgi:hypothetical protein
MPDIFESSRQKIAWAEKRLTELEREISDFGQLNPYEQVTEPHPDKPGHVVHKIKLTYALPPAIAHITGEVANSLRSALDNAGYSIAVAAGCVNPKSSAFPFAGSADGMSKAIGGRCKDIPQPIQSLFCGFQPYPGGNYLLWALNEICNTDKHKIAIPFGTGAYPIGVSARGTGGYMCIPTPHIWDSAKNEMTLITLGPGVKFDYEFDFRFFVAFGEIKLVAGKPVVSVLNAVGSIVQGVLVAIEAESRRLGFVK